ncbi:MAG: DUF2312 domain-containing protein [Alphaproteobacteria bacterium]|nr:DUF2312 domain-containing protein [Alphaproteobacteria bacterium]
MAKNSAKNYNVDLMQPDEINALKTVVKEFIGRLENVDNEIELLKEDRKALIEEYKGKLDLKTLTAALKVIKIQSSVAHRDTYDLFLEALGEE